MEIDHEIISTFIFMPSAETFKMGCCQLQAKVSCARSTGKLIVQACQRKRVVRTDCPVMTIVDDLDIKNKTHKNGSSHYET